MGATAGSWVFHQRASATARRAEDSGGQEGRGGHGSGGGSSTNSGGRVGTDAEAGGTQSSQKDEWRRDGRGHNDEQGRHSAGGRQLGETAAQPRIVASEAAARPLNIELATSRALLADGGSIRIAWADGSTLLAQGVAAGLEGGSPCPHVPAAVCACVGACGSFPRGLQQEIRSGGSGSAERANARAVALGGIAAGVNGTAGDAAAAEGQRGSGRPVVQPPAGGDGRQWLAASAVLVLVARGERAVLSLVEPSEDVVAAARAAVSLLESQDLPGGFTRQLEAAVAAAYEALQGIPRAVGLPDSASANDKRLARKLYDIMSVNTGPDWSTPDRTPHAWQWLWDSCFHAMGMNLVNHTLAWEQLKGLLHCQREDGFLPHMCGGGPPSRMTQPPLLAWAVWDNYLFARDRRRLEWALPRIIKLLEWLAQHRSRDGGLTYFYVHGFESGMDNSPRFDGGGLGSWVGSVVRGWSGDPAAGTCPLCTPHEMSVDLCALVAREMAHVARMLRELGREQESERWLVRSRAVAAALAQAAWNPGARIYGDVVREGSPLQLLGSGRRRVSDLVTVAGLLPLLGGRLPQEHLESLLEHLKNPDSFASPVPLPSVAVSSQRRGAAGAAAAAAGTAAGAEGSVYQPHNDMWKGPMWVNINMMVATGLREQRCSECSRLAIQLLNITVATVRKWYGQGSPGSISSGDPGGDSAGRPGSGVAASATALGTVFEYYDSDGILPPTRLARKRVAGVGGVRDYHWTASLTLRMMAELYALSGHHPGSYSGVHKAAVGLSAWATGTVSTATGGVGDAEVDGLPAWVSGRPLRPSDWQ
ncbi:hypothetical protein GPECTOR_34g711 [Gonium pectorale]|uniref:Mannosylglycerate hydrolase MGH1-like glycoside hydrolase domain-containing protein n=1 Tax=Gonium pectorale TaxID=33097 RepID=A0A150GCH6_GONPE|nr:hypothetical protein GPECTOR_34g711 [Gonium pectorale]|eukprot:KXZ47552.1 hypothetical protein GPECTOR_34g711 [Gonium pectorale]